MEERKIKVVSFAMPSLDDPESVTVGLYDEAGHFRLRFTRNQMIELALKGLGAATAPANGENVGMEIVAFEPTGFPDGGVALVLQVRSGDRLRFRLDPEGTKALLEALTTAIQGAVSSHPTATRRDH